VRCQATTSNRSRCTRKTCKYGFQCWQHSIKNLGLSVKKSTVPGAGLGLFAEKAFPRKKKIIEYKGEKINTTELNRRYPGDTVGTYVVSANANHHIDARKSPTSSIARYANDARGTAKTNNAQLETHDRNKVYLVTKAKAIKKDQEVLTSYGGEYWGDARGKRAKRTKRVKHTG